ncbi:MAG: hypothetical protein OJF47_001784 [Nitrospira sp.]|nr:MAG: hypothetical protein OJF47_001784 [Nitrospira sp.]
MKYAEGTGRKVNGSSDHPTDAARRTSFGGIDGEVEQSDEW